MERRRLLLVVAAVIAALGIGLVFFYAQGAESRAADKYDAVEVLTASQEILPGESFDDALKANKLRLTFVSRGQLLDGASKDTDPLKGKVALTKIYPKEQLTPAKFGGAEDVQAAAQLAIPAGKIAISVTLNDDTRVGTFVSAGSDVAVIATVENSYSCNLLQKVRVLGFGKKTTVDSEGAEDTSSRGDLQYLVTLAVTQREALKVRFAESLQGGSLSLGLVNDGSQVKADECVNNGDLFDSKKTKG